MTRSYFLIIIYVVTEASFLILGNAQQKILANDWAKVQQVWGMWYHRCLGRWNNSCKVGGKTCAKLGCTACAGIGAWRYNFYHYLSS